jgi:hypothetical protein
MKTFLVSYTRLAERQYRVTADSPERAVELIWDGEEELPEERVELVRDRDVCDDASSVDVEEWPWSDGGVSAAPADPRHRDGGTTNRSASLPAGAW